MSDNKNSNSLQNPYSNDEEDPYNYDYQPFGADKSNYEDMSSNLNTKYEDISIQPTMDENTYMSDVQFEPSNNEDEIKRKERELAEREESLTQREQTVGSVAEKKKNFPICYPLVRHSLHDIPQRFRRIITTLGFAGWIAFSIILILNFFTAIICILPFGSPSNEKNQLETWAKFRYFVFSFIFVIFGIPSHFVLSYWPLYKAMLTCNILRFFVFLAGYLLPILFCGFCTTGWYEYGPSGLMLTVIMFPYLGAGGNSLAFYTNLLMSILWTVMALYFFFIAICVVKVFRDQNTTFKKAKEFANSEFVKTVTSGVSNVVGANEETPSQV